MRNGQRISGILISTTFLACCLMSGCQSTAKTEPECRPENSQTCEGDDRGYDPCLVNKNLPVCKK